jgi:hypothetical protein
MFIETLDNKTIQYKFILTIYHEDNYIMCKLYNGDIHSLFCNDYINRDMINKQSIYTQLEISRDLQ